MKQAFLFPGQGAQYPGMGKTFYENYPIAKQTFEEAEDILGRKLTSLIFDGPIDELTRTENSQLAIFIASFAILRTAGELFPGLEPSACAGLSLGEYTALAASARLSFSETLKLVQKRGRFMSEACDQTKGTMAVILGLASEEVEEIVDAVNLPDDLFAANFNCPGQVVVSGTEKGIAAASEAAAAKGAKRVLPLQVHGAFHSGLMRSAKERLMPYIQEASIEDGEKTPLVMNVPGKVVEAPDEIKRNLVEQVTAPVRWEQGIRSMESAGFGTYIEMGPGKTLSGFNKRIGVLGQTISIEIVDDLKKLEQILA